MPMLPVLACVARIYRKLTPIENTGQAQLISNAGLSSEFNKIIPLNTSTDNIQIDRLSGHKSYQITTECVCARMHLCMYGHVHAGKHMHAYAQRQWVNI